MQIDINVKKTIGERYSVEDAILLREVINNNIDSKIVLDFEGISKISTAFLTTLFNDLILKFGREYIFKQINVKNISNYSDYSRVVLGTAFIA